MARKTQRTAQGPREPALHIKELEPRLLLSAEPVGTFLRGVLDPLHAATEVVLDDDLIEYQQAITGMGQPS